MSLAAHPKGTRHLAQGPGARRLSGKPASNRGGTSLKLKRRQSNPMRDYDRLPADLRLWLSRAVLPWRPASVRRAFDKAMARTRDRHKALRELDLLQDRLISKDALSVWGTEHPEAQRLDLADNRLEAKAQR